MDNFPPDFVENFLKLHNYYRTLHKSPPLQINDKLSEYAQEWADDLAKRGILEHRPQTEYGENIYVSFWRNVPSDIKPKDPLESWYREGRFFNYGEDQVPNLQDVRHFTQMVWSETKSMGLGMATGFDGKIYFVCNYDPPGNVDGQFASNVSSSLTGEAELPPEQAKGIKSIKPRINVVSSMERVYAVPSEKLRVWSVWLTKVGEMADEWQRWLRSYIDLVIRLSDNLQAAEDAIRRAKEEEDALKQRLSSKSDAGKTLDAVDDSAQGEVVDDQETTEAAADEAEESAKEEETEESAKEGETEEPAKEGETEESAKEGETEEPAKEEETEEPAKEEETEKSAKEEETEESAKQEETEDLEAASEATLTPDANQDGLMTWPIGTPWQPLGFVDEIEKVEFEKLPMPRNEEEMEQLLQQFTQEATIFRSYYKHWSDTADQAIKEIGGRLVLATYITRGKGRKQKRRLSTRSSRYLSALSGSIRSGLIPPAKSKSSAVQPASSAVQSASSVVQPAASAKSVASEQKAEESDDDEEYFTPEQSKSDTPTVIENVPKASVSSSRRSSKAAPSSEYLDVDDLVKDCSRAAEPIPYFFYLKAEPDIDIAIEHDDQEVIPADLDREKVISEYKRIFFNLKDKPCKRGKPWL